MLSKFICKKPILIPYLPREMFTAELVWSVFTDFLLGFFQAELELEFLASYNCRIKASPFNWSYKVLGIIFGIHLSAISFSKNPLVLLSCFSSTLVVLSSEVHSWRITLRSESYSSTKPNGGESYIKLRSSSPYIKLSAYLPCPFFKFQEESPVSKITNQLDAHGFIFLEDW